MALINHDTEYWPVIISEYECSPWDALKLRKFLCRITLHRIVKCPYFKTMAKSSLLKRLSQFTYGLFYQHVILQRFMPSLSTTC